MNIDFVTVGMMAGSAALHTAYFVLLNQGYRVGDLSLVYPLARATGPLLSSLGQFNSWRTAVCHRARGALLIIGGVCRLDDEPFTMRQSGAQDAVLYAMVTGLFIAAYTLWDKQAVSHFAIAPLVLDWGANVGRALLLAPFAIKYSDQAVIEWREHKYEAIAIAILIPLSYILVLTADAFHTRELRRAGARDQHSIGTAMERVYSPRRRTAKMVAACAWYWAWWRWRSVKR